MGLYDYVNHPSIPCWRCARPVIGWETKTGFDPGLATILPEQCASFYSRCSRCGAWNEYIVVVDEYHIERDTSGCQTCGFPEGHGERECPYPWS